MISFNIHEIAINPISTNFFASQGFENLVTVITSIVTFVAVFIAIKTYLSDVKQKKITNTQDFIHNFLDGDWVSQEDKGNWNTFFNERLERNACGLFSLTGKYYSESDEYSQLKTPADIAEIFSEGLNSHFGNSISSIMNILEYIAKKVNNDELDLGLINIRLLRFYQLADFYNEILQKDGQEYNFGNSYPEITKLYKRLGNLYKNNEPLGVYCTFQLEQRFQPPRRAQYPHR